MVARAKWDDMEPHAVPSHPIRAHRRSWFLLQNRGQVPRQYGGDETREVAAGEPRNGKAHLTITGEIRRANEGSNAGDALGCRPGDNRLDPGGNMFTSDHFDK